MTDPSSAEAAARARDSACRLASKSWPKALDTARDISLPWYRCQALSHVAASATTPGDFERAIDAAICACESGDEPYKVVAVSSWPIAALIKAGHTTRASALARRMVDLAPAVSPDSSRAEALVLLFQAIATIPDRHRDRIAEELLSLAARGHWRAKRAVKHVALMIASEDRPRALEYIARFPDGVPSKATRAAIESGGALTPRPFV